MASQLGSNGSFAGQQFSLRSVLVHSNHREQPLASLCVASLTEAPVDHFEPGVNSSLMPYVDLVNVPVVFESGEGQAITRRRASRSHTMNVRDIFLSTGSINQSHGALASPGELVFDPHASAKVALDPLVPQTQGSSVAFASPDVMLSSGKPYTEDKTSPSSPRISPLILLPTDAASTPSRAVMTTVVSRVSMTCESEYPPTISRFNSRRVEEVFEGVGELDAPYEPGSGAASSSLAVRCLIDGSTRRSRSIRGSKGRTAAARARPRVQDIFALPTGLKN